MDAFSPEVQRRFPEQNGDANGDDEHLQDAGLSQPADTAQFHERADEHGHGHGSDNGPEER